MFLKRSGFGVHTSLSKTRTNNRPSFFWSRIHPANGARIRPISMVPCERKADLDEFEHGLEFVRSRVNGVLRPVSTQENKHRIGLDCFPSCIIHTAGPKKLKNTSTLFHRIIGSNWNRKLVPKANARVQFCSDPVRSHAYFPEWKPAFM